MLFLRRPFGTDVRVREVAEHGLVTTNATKGFNWPMLRVLSGIAGVFLLVVPSLMLYDMSIPVRQYRTGTYTDYQAFVRACLIVYGGAAAGIAVQWWRSVRQRRPLRGASVLGAGLTGVLVLVAVTLVLASVETGPGNLVGVVVILGAVFGAIVSGGAALVWRALRAGA